MTQVQPHTSAIRDTVTELITETATRLPADVQSALQRARRREESTGPARATLTTVLENAALAIRDQATICQDTGTLTFYGRIPANWDVATLEKGIRAGVRVASRRGILRQNTIDSVTGRPIPDNLATDAPIIHWKPRRGQRLDLCLLMKGGGCENMSAQYSLPHTSLGAGRDMEGVRRCILDAVTVAQGHGCAPGILGICIGGDRATGYAIAKRQFMRLLDDSAPEPVLAAMEQRILREANTLDIGPMGMGGRTTLLGVKITAASRLPASFFVTVAYMCWALRRNGIRMSPEGTIDRWLTSREIGA